VTRRPSLASQMTAGQRRHARLAASLVTLAGLGATTATLSGADLGDGSLAGIASLFVGVAALITLRPRVSKVTTRFKSEGRGVQVTP